MTYSSGFFQHRLCIWNFLNRFSHSPSVSLFFPLIIFILFHFPLPPCMSPFFKLAFVCFAYHSVQNRNDNKIRFHCTGHPCLLTLHAHNLCSAVTMSTIHFWCTQLRAQRTTTEKSIIVLRGARQHLSTTKQSTERDCDLFL